MITVLEQSRASRKGAWRGPVEDRQGPGPGQICHKGKESGFNSEAVRLRLEIVNEGGFFCPT